MGSPAEPGTFQVPDEDRHDESEPTTVAEHLTTPEERLKIARDTLQRYVDANDGDGQVLAAIVLAQMRQDLGVGQVAPDPEVRTEAPPARGRTHRVLTGELLERSNVGVLFDDQLAAVRGALALLDDSDAPVMNREVANAVRALRAATRNHERVTRGYQQMQSLLGFAKDTGIELSEEQREAISETLLNGES